MRRSLRREEVSMDKELVVFGVVVAALAAAVALALWLREPAPLARVAVEALAEREMRPAAPAAAKRSARPSKPQDRRGDIPYRGL